MLPFLLPVIGAASGLNNFFEGRRLRRKSEKEMMNFKWGELTNPYSNVSVSTLGADLKAEEAGRLASTQTAALQNSGTRGIIGGLGRVSANNQRVNREIAANLDAQQQNINELIAQDDVRIQGMTEARDRGRLEGLGAKYDLGLGLMQQGTNQLVNTAGYISDMETPFKMDEGKKLLRKKIREERRKEKDETTVTEQLYNDPSRLGGFGFDEFGVPLMRPRQ